jgi:alkaline phosphatase D
MKKVSRREFLATAASIGAVAAFARSGMAKSGATKSRVQWTERRDLYPEGVASGDPQADSVLLWTRRPGGCSKRASDLRSRDGPGVRA